MKSISHSFVRVGNMKAIKLIEPIFEIFYKDILLFKISLPNCWLFRSSIFNYFNEVLLEPQMLWSSLDLFSIACLKVPQLLPVF